jgi:hypothetical protein
MARWTFFTCTNASFAPVVVGIEVFGSSGGVGSNDASLASLELSPAATARFGTCVASTLLRAFPSLDSPPTSRVGGRARTAPGPLFRTRIP